jgi:hypothetical protein
MRLTLLSLAFGITLSPMCLAQQWEFGATSGYSFYTNASIGNPIAEQSASAGFRPGYTLGAVFGENLYNYVGGELRYLFLWGTPQINFQGTRATMAGYTNLVVYDVLVHMASRDSSVRPYLAAGAGIKVYGGTSAGSLMQPLTQFAVLRPLTQVEPAVSVGGGLKYLVARHALLRADFRAYMSALPNHLFRTTGVSEIRGWVYNFVPQVGVGYLFR